MGSLKSIITNFQKFLGLLRNILIYHAFNVGHQIPLINLLFSIVLVNSY